MSYTHSRFTCLMHIIEIKHSVFAILLNIFKIWKVLFYNLLFNACCRMKITDIPSTFQIYIFNTCAYGEPSRKFE